MFPDPSRSLGPDGYATADDELADLLLEAMGLEMEESDWPAVVELLRLFFWDGFWFELGHLDAALIAEFAERRMALNDAFALVPRQLRLQAQARGQWYADELRAR